VIVFLIVFCFYEADGGDDPKTHVGAGTMFCVFFLKKNGTLQ
jgi:hypothetical protein